MQALQTFSKFSSKQSYPEQLAALQKLLSEVSSNDLNFDPDLVAESGNAAEEKGQCQSRKAPVDYVHMWEEDSVFSMGVFVLKRGFTLPLHDHPNMTGLIKVIQGKVAVNSFTLQSDATVPEEVLKDMRPWQRPTVKPVEQLPLKELDATSEAIILTPSEANFHEITAVDGPAAFLDILAPPYDHSTGQRECHYYKVHKGSDGEKDSVKYLVEVPQPREYFCSLAEYLGPEIDPYADLL